MSKTSRCLYESDIATFLMKGRATLLGILCEAYHGDALTTTREAWMGEIEILQVALNPWRDSDGRIIFEYDIPRLGKRIDVVLLLRGIIFCLEFKVGESSIQECDVDQVLDYALDLKNFHQGSADRMIVPILVPTENNQTSTICRLSHYDDGIYEPLVANQPMSIQDDKGNHWWQIRIRLAWL